MTPVVAGISWQVVGVAMAASFCVSIEKVRKCSLRSDRKSFKLGTGISRFEVSTVHLASGTFSLMAKDQR